MNEDINVEIFDSVNNKNELQVAGKHENYSQLKSSFSFNNN